MENSQRIEQLLISNDDASENRFLIAHSTVNEKKYSFVVFRGLDKLGDSLKSNSLPKIAPVKIFQKGFFQKSQLGNFEYLKELLFKCDYLIITGHSLGGACATQLTSNFISKFPAFGMNQKLKCVTFGSPLVGLRALPCYLPIYKKTFHHFVVDKDIFPRLLSLPDNVLKFGHWDFQSESFSKLDSHSVITKQLILELSSVLYHQIAFGTYYKIFKSPDATPTEEAEKHYFVKLQDKEVVSYFKRSPKSFDENSVLEHSMNRYLFYLYSSKICTRSPHIDRVEEIEEIKENISATHVVFDKKSISIFGESLGLVYSALVEDESRVNLTNIIESSDKMIKFSFSKTLYHDQIDEANLTLFSLTGVVKTVKVQVFDGLDKRKKDNYPNEVLGSILPILNLLKMSHCEGLALVDRVEEIRKHVDAIQDCIPIEMAYSMLTLETVNNNENKEFLEIFLNRLAEIHVKDLAKSLSSKYMISILVEAIKNTSNYDNIRLLDICFSKPEPIESNEFGYIISPSQTKAFYVTSALSNEDLIKFVFENRIGMTISFNKDFKLDDLVKDAKWISYTHKESFSLLINGADFGAKMHIFSIKAGLKTRSYKVLDLTRVIENIQKLKDERSLFNLHYLEIIDFVERVIEYSYSNRIHVIPESTEKNNNPGFTSFLLTWFYFEQEKTYRDFNRLKESFKRAKIEITSSDHIDFILKTIASSVDKERYKKNKPITFNSIAFQLGKSFGHRDKPSSRVVKKLETILKEMKSNSERAKAPFICGKSILMKVMNDRSNEEVDFFDFIPDHKDINFNSQEDLLNKTKEVVKGVKFLNLMVDNLITTTNETMSIYYETKIESYLNIAFNSLGVIAATPAIAVYGAGKTIYGAFSKDYQNIVDVEELFLSLWHSVFFRGQKFENYKELLKDLTKRLGLDPELLKSTMDMEKSIIRAIDSSIEHMNADQLLAEYPRIFHKAFHPLFESDRSRGVFAFILKIMYHCSRIRELRKNLCLVTVNGEKNAGKSTLIKNLIGKNTLGASIKTGKNAGATTIFPCAYPLVREEQKTHVDQKPVFLVDLPGSNDRDTFEIATLFSSSNDIGIFLVKSESPTNPNDVSFATFIKNSILNRRGPVLICLTQFDQILSEFDEQEYPEVFEQEVGKWRKCEYLNTQRIISPTPRWKCEHSKPLGIVHSSGLSQDLFSYPLTIWMTSFVETGENIEKIRSLIFTEEDVKEWIKEASDWLSSFNSSD